MISLAVPWIPTAYSFTGSDTHPEERNPGTAVFRMQEFIRAMGISGAGYEFESGPCPKSHHSRFIIFIAVDDLEGKTNIPDQLPEKIHLFLVKKINFAGVKPHGTNDPVAAL